jgi:uncharacterized LabA/DUF88 family protein
MRTIAYVDGYNLYYGLKKLCGPARQWRWLNLEAFCERYVPNEYELVEIKYFTARVKPKDSSKRRRQEAFLRALGTLERVTLHFGRYERYEAEYPLAEGPDKGKPVWVWKIEEKESDVKIASHLLLDALVADEPVEAAVLISNDSDQVFPLKKLKQAGIHVGIVNPHPRRPSGALADIARFYRQVKPGQVTASQLPRRLEDAGGVFEMPERWAVQDDTDPSSAPKTPD